VTTDSRWVVLDNKDPDAVAGPEIDRANATDLMEFLTDTTGHPNIVAAVLMLDGTPSLAELRHALEERIRAVPRMRRLLVRSPFGCGRAIWVDDPNFDIDNHVGTIDTYRGTEFEALEYAAELAAARVRDYRPLWSSYLITHLEGGRSALLITLHHVLADGIGGIATLSKLVDDAPPVPLGKFPQPRPGRGALFRDAVRTRARAVRNLPAGVRKVAAAASELGLSGTRRAPKTSLNRKTQRHRTLWVARAELAAVRATGHKYDATVNDVLLTAVSGTLGKLLRHRGETVDRLVVSVPVSARKEANVTELGNQVGAMLVEVPLSGDPFERLATIAETTRKRKSQTRGTSAVLLTPALRGLGWLGLLRLYVRRQRRVNTFVTNVRGPKERLSLLGIPVREVIPVGYTTGNVTVSFTALSYAGRLVVTATTDRMIFGESGDSRMLANELQAQLDILTMPQLSLPETTDTKAESDPTGPDAGESDH
jgi:WS/DGAT/MGAT family acyltransferase